MHGGAPSPDRDVRRGRPHGWSPRATSISGAISPLATSAMSSRRRGFIVVRQVIIKRWIGGIPLAPDSFESVVRAPGQIDVESVDQLCDRAAKDQGSQKQLRRVAALFG